MKIEVHKLKPHLSSSNKVLDKLKIIDNITDNAYHWLIAYFVNTLSCSFNDSYSFANTSTASSLNNIDLLLLSQIDFSFSISALDLLLSSSMSTFSRNCSLLFKQWNIFQLLTKSATSSLLSNVKKCGFLHFVYCDCYRSVTWNAKWYLGAKTPPQATTVTFLYKIFKRKFSL